MTEVGAAEGVEVDPLDAGGVHRDRSLGAEEPEAVAVRRQVDLLGAACAVEEHRVGAVLAFDDVAAVAGIPDEGVVAGAHQPRVGAAVSVDRVVAVAADQALGSGASAEGVASGLAVEEERDGAAGEPGGVDRVIAGEAVDAELIGRLLVLNRHERPQA